MFTCVNSSIRISGFLRTFHGSLRDQREMPLFNRRFTQTTRPLSAFTKGVRTRVGKHDLAIFLSNLVTFSPNLLLIRWSQSRPDGFVGKMTIPVPSWLQLCRCRRGKMIIQYARECVNIWHALCRHIGVCVYACDRDSSFLTFPLCFSLSLFVSRRARDYKKPEILCPSLNLASTLLREYDILACSCFTSHSKILSLSRRRQQDATKGEPSYLYKKCDTVNSM